MWALPRTYGSAPTGPAPAARGQRRRVAVGQGEVDVVGDVNLRGEARGGRLDFDRLAGDVGSRVDIEADAGAAGLLEGAVVVVLGAPTGVRIAVDGVLVVFAIFGAGAEWVVVVGRRLREWDRDQPRLRDYVRRAGRGARRSRR